MNLPSYLLPLCFLTCLATAQAGKQRLFYTVTDLGTLPGDDFSYATAINSQGAIVGYGITGGFVYKDGVMTSLQSGVAHNPSNVTQLRPTAISNLGIVAGSGMVAASGGGQVPVGFILSSGVLETTYGAGNPGREIAITSVNDSNQLVGYNYDGNLSGELAAASLPRAFVDNFGSITSIFPGENASAFGINTAGQIAGTLGIPGTKKGSHAFLYENGESHLLGTIPGFGGDSTAAGINARGDIAGTIASTASKGPSSGSRAFLYSRGRMTNLGVPASLNSKSHLEISATALNEKGEVVGDLASGTNGRPFVFNAGKIDSLQDLVSKNSGWTLLHASGINDAGAIIGYGKSPSGFTHGFLLTPLPAVTIAGPARRVTSRSQITLRGTAAGTPYRVITTIGRRRHHKLRDAVGTTRWHAIFALHQGLNYLNARAITTTGASTTATVVVERK